MEESDIIHSLKAHYHFSFLMTVVHELGNAFQGFNLHL